MTPAQIAEIDAITSPSRRVLVYSHMDAGRVDMALQALALSDGFCAEQDRRLWWSVVLGMVAAMRCKNNGTTADRITIQPDHGATRRP